MASLVDTASVPRLFRALIIEDDLLCANLVIDALTTAPFGEVDVYYVGSLSEARQCLCEQVFDFIVLDLNLDDSDAKNTVDTIATLAAETPIVVMSAETDDELLVSSIKQGAQDFLSKLNRFEPEMFYRHIEFALARAERQQAIFRKAHFDQLTGLPNRYMFNDRLAATQAGAARNNTSFVIFFIDLNHFKPVNDTHGHDAGDAVLVEIAARLREIFRGDDIVARLGGDEFCVIANGANAEAIETVRNKMKAAIAKPIIWRGNSLHMSASIGASVYPRDGQELEELVGAADRAMYGEKNARTR